MSGKIISSIGILGICVSLNAQERGKIIDLGQPVLGAERIWALTSCEGKVYGATWHDLSSHLFVYDPSTQSSTDLGVLEDVKIYALTTGHNNLIYGVVLAKIRPGEPPYRHHLLIYNPELPWNPGRSSFNNPYIKGPIFPFSSGYLATITTADDGKIYGGTGDRNFMGRAYLFCYDPTNDTIINLGRPSPYAYVITDLTCTQGKIYGGLYGISTKDFFVYDPSTGNTVLLGDAIEGYVWNLVVHESGKIYGTSDGQHWLFVYDPNMPWDPGPIEGSNPYWIGKVPLGWGSINDLVEGANGRLYGCDSGATFFSYDPRLGWLPGDGDTSNPRIYYNVIPGETNILTLTCVDNWDIYGGTGRNAHLFVFVPEFPLPCELLEYFKIELISGREYEEIIEEVMADSQVMQLHEYLITHNFKKIPTYNFVSHAIYTPTSDTFTGVFLQYAYDTTFNVIKEVEGATIVYVKNPLPMQDIETVIWHYKYEFGKPVLIQELTVKKGVIEKIKGWWDRTKKCWGNFLNPVAIGCGVAVVVGTVKAGLHGAAVTGVACAGATAVVGIGCAVVNIFTGEKKQETIDKSKDEEQN